MSDKISSEKDRISELITQLLSPHKIIRDILHDDIMITDLEANIIDTREFQRLRWLRQLGLTNLVYPGANHTRFEHSLGTLAIAQRIMDSVNANSYKDIEIQQHHRLLIRLCALVHDICCVPFGHTLEVEGRLLEPWWKDEKRIKCIFGEDSDIVRAMFEHEILKELSHLDKEFHPKEVLRKIKEVIISIKRNQDEFLDEPFIADIVNTADLLDYVKRDAYFTGIQEAYDERLLSCFYVTNYKGKPRLVLRLIDPSTGMMRRHILSDVLHLLRLRYSLSEKVYHHRAKIAASAMLASGVNAMLQNARLSVENLYAMTDEELVLQMKKSENEIENHLIENVLGRKFYKIVYELTFDEKGIEGPETVHKEKIINELRNPRRRYQIERELESRNNLKPGSVIIYCPLSEGVEKALEIIVLGGPRKTDMGSLEQITDERTREDIESITKKYRELWRMYVLVDPSLTKYEQDILRVACEELFRLPSAEERNGVSIIIPAYNEESMISRVILDIEKVMNSTRPYEIIVVDDGSADMTGEVARNLGAIVIQHDSNQGFGRAVWSGIKEAHYPTVVIIDANGQYDPKDIPRLIKPIETEGVDVVLGSRFLGEIRPGAMSFWDKVLNKVFTLIYSTCGIKMTDSQTGFRAYVKEKVENFPPTLNDFSSQGEMLAKMAKKRLQIKEVPIVYRPRVGIKYSTFSSVKQGLALFKSLIKIMLEAE
jgi:HD superfamily phosphohydrolase